MSYAGPTVTLFKSNGTLKNGVLKATAGEVTGVSFHNTNAAAAYLRLYNKATAPATGDTPVAEFVLPGGTTGGSRDIPFPFPMHFATGIGYRIVTEAASNGDTATASNEVVVNFFWK